MTERRAGRYVRLELVWTADTSAPARCRYLAKWLFGTWRAQNGNAGRAPIVTSGLAFFQAGPKPSGQSRTRLLADWEAGRMTPAFGVIDPEVHRDLWFGDLLAVGAERGYYCLTPAGLAAARAVKGEK